MSAHQSIRLGRSSQNKTNPVRASSSPYGDFETMIQTLSGQLAKGPSILGNCFTAADVLWGVALAWTTQFGLVPQTPFIQDYIERVTARPAFVRAREKDAQLMESKKS